MDCRFGPRLFEIGREPPDLGFRLVEGELYPVKDPNPLLGRRDRDLKVIKPLLQRLDLTIAEREIHSDGGGIEPPQV